MRPAFLRFDLSPRKASRVLMGFVLVFVSCWSFLEFLGCASGGDGVWVTARRVSQSCQLMVGEIEYGKKFLFFFCSHLHLGHEFGGFFFTFASVLSYFIVSRRVATINPATNISLTQDFLLLLILLSKSSSKNIY